MQQKLILAVLYLAAYLPWRVLSLLGNLAGRMMYRLDGQEAHVARVNLQIAYPQLQDVERERLLKRSLIASAITLCEMPRIWLRPIGRDTRIRDHGLADQVRELLKRGHGLILAMPHQGNWEMVSRASSLDLRVTGLYRPPRQTFLEPLMEAGRKVSNVVTVPTSRSGIKALHETLKSGNVVAILPDQVPRNAGSAATSAPFFGRESHTMVLLSRLAARHSSPVLFVWARRAEDGRYDMQYFEAPAEIRDPDPHRAACALNAAVEQCIADAPEQYQWSYRRFKSTVEGQPGPYRRARARR